MKNTLLLLCIVLGTITFAACDDEPKNADVQEIYFETSYRNAAWGLQSSGTFIDEKGKEHAYNLPNQWYTCDSLGEISKADLMLNLKNCNSIARTVNSDTLNVMIAQINALNTDSISQEGISTADYGSKNYYAYKYNAVTNKYQRILIKSIGDYPQINKCKAALEIAKLWGIENAHP